MIFPAMNRDLQTIYSDYSGLEGAKEAMAAMAIHIPIHSRFTWELQS